MDMHTKIARQRALACVPVCLRARELWSVQWIDSDEFNFEFKGHGSIHRFWDATPCVEFMYKIAEETLRHDLQGEVEFLHRYEAVLREADARFDIPGSTLSQLVRMAC